MSANQAVWAFAFGATTMGREMMDDRTSLERALARTDDDCDRRTQERAGSELAGEAAAND